MPGDKSIKVLAGDIGGTRARIAIIEDGRVLFKKHYASRDYPGPVEVLEEFQKDYGRLLPKEASIAVAGVVENHQFVKATNITWTVSTHELKQAFGFNKVHLLNDFEAVAWGILTLEDAELVKLGKGKPDPYGPKTVLGAGTGLGQAFVIRCNGGFKVIPTEGGHTDFAPRTSEQIRLLSFLMEKMEHVSVEQVLSGPGLVNIYRFVLMDENNQDDPLKGVPETELPASITALSRKDEHSPCARALRIFVQIYGQEAGNMALKSLAVGGVYVAGGIAPKIIDELRRFGFRQAFEAKGRMKKVLSQIPTYIITDPDLGLKGAWKFSLQMALEYKRFS